MALTDRVFSMHPDESLNPYAAPKAQLVYPDKNGTGAPRRPASVRWATFVMGFFTMIMGMLYWQAIEAQGAESIWREQSFFDPTLLLPFGLVLSLFGGRRKTAYYGVVIALALLVLKSCYSTLMHWSAVGAFADPFWAQRFLEALMSYAIGYLFYRFTFGLPSRRYFGVAREEERVV